MFGYVFIDVWVVPYIQHDTLPFRGMKHVLGASSLGCYCGDDDYVVLEDEGGRMSLSGACLPVQELVTGESEVKGTMDNPCLGAGHTRSPLSSPSGVVMAVKGHADPGGDFLVDDVCYLGLAPQPPRPPPPAEDKYIALVSGLGLGRPETDMLKVRFILI